MWDVSPTMRSAKLQLVYGLKMSKTTALDTFTIQTFYLYMHCVYGWWLLSMSLSPNTADEPEYNIEDQAIAMPDLQRDLGIASSRHTIACIYTLRRTLPSSSPIHLKKKLYLTLVRSHFSYCCQLWKPRLIKDIR